MPPEFEDFPSHKCNMKDGVVVNPWFCMIRAKSHYRTPKLILENSVSVTPLHRRVLPNSNSIVRQPPWRSCENHAKTRDFLTLQNFRPQDSTVASAFPLRYNYAKFLFKTMNRTGINSDCLELILLQFYVVI